MSFEDFLNSDDDYEDFFLKSPYDRSILEKLALAIIDAHPKGTDTKQTRLNKAMQALIGENASKLPMPDDLDAKALLVMGQQRHADKSNAKLHEWKHRKEQNPPEPTKLRSVTALARYAVRQCFSDRLSEEEIEVTVSRLRNKFSGSYGGESTKDGHVDRPATHEFLAVERDYVTETLEHQALEKICKVLSMHGIKTDL